MSHFERNNVVVMRKAVQPQQRVAEVREATTGRVVSAPRLVVVPRPVRLERVWAVAEPMPDQAPVAPAHDDGTVMNGAPAVVAPDARVELAFYRKYTEALLRRYLRLSMAAGRVPSLMGREMFRGHVTHYRSTTFEDVVIFCFDMEKQIAKLKPMEQRLIARIALQHYSQGEAAAMLGLSLRGAVQRYAEALDNLTRMLLATRLLAPLESCQEGSSE